MRASDPLKSRRVGRAADAILSAGPKLSAEQSELGSNPSFQLIEQSWSLTGLLTVEVGPAGKEAMVLEHCGLRVCVVGNVSVNALANF